MVEAEDTGDVKLAGEVGEALQAEDVEGEADENAADEAVDAAPQPPRRRVAELLEGQETLEESVRHSQLVAPPVHLEPLSADQPFYQLDLSSEEPQGTLVEPERPSRARSSTSDTAVARSIDAGDTRTVIKYLIMQRDRRVMAAERDGIDAYELAVNLDDFVQKIIDTVRDGD